MKNNLEKIENFIESEVEKLIKVFHLELWEVKLLPDPKLGKKTQIYVKSIVDGSRMELTVSYVDEIPEEYIEEEKMFFDVLKKDLIFELSIAVTGKVLTSLLEYGVKKTTASFLCSEISRLLVDMYKKMDKKKVKNEKVIK